MLGYLNTPSAAKSTDRRTYRAPTRFWFPSPRSLSGLWLLAFVLSGGLAGTAQGQLRNGRTQRALYVDEVAPSRTPAAAARGTTGLVASSGQPATSTGSTRRPTAAVRTASGQSPSPLISSGVQQQRLAVSSPAYQAGAACDDCGDTFFDGPLSEFDSAGYGTCGPLGCDDPGCASCGCYSDLAPTCSAMACSPGCGPLMSLWCRMSVRAEVPLYWRRAMGPPALVTTAPEGTDPDLAGELGQNSTSILLGNGILNDKASAGVRLTFSTWLGSEQRYALMFRYWNAGTRDDTFNFSSDQNAILARPFRDTSVTPAVANTQLIAFPGDSIGNISVATTSAVDGLELTLKRMIYQDRFTRVDWLYGYQHVSIDESLRVSSNTVVTGNIPGLQGNAIAVRDEFRTQNDFNGMAYGLMSSRQIACWKMETLFRLGLGNLRRQVNINGSTTTTANGTSLTSPQGLLARNTNAQPFVDDTFVVVPEVGINFASQIRPGLDFTVGYNYMLVPKVAQASQQISNNLAVNLSDPLVGSLDPQLTFNARKYWINSLGLGLQLRY